MSVFVIAECGVNHQGHFDTALELVQAAKKSGADAVKFQLFDAEKLGRHEIKHLQLSRPQITDLAAWAKSLEIEFLCTPFDFDAIHFLVPLVKRLKIASGFVENKEFLLEAAITNLPIILSTGMSDMGQVKEAVDIIGTDLTLLHCTSTYPCPMQDVNLRAMTSLSKAFAVPVGFSDHTDGIVAAIGAVALGASVIEKHLTLDRRSIGPDHKASIEPASFAAMVSGIRQMEKALGDSEKKPMPSEAPVMKIWQR